MDRRIIGADWLQGPFPASGIPKIIFGSLKGGVGRSTALCVAAAALAAKGIRVLVIDLDVEAPVGSMLLTPNTTPTSGLLDYLVEANLGQTPDGMFVDLTAPSWLAAGEGVLDVIPAIGASTIKHPSNVLAKIARAYIGSVEGQVDGITSRLKSLVDYVSDSGRYDIILIDARAGFHETTGAALLGLGAHILLFGVAQPQTYAAYDLLFANLAFVQREQWDGWITIVQAKAPAAVEKQSDFATRFRRLLTDRLTVETSASTVSLEELRTVFDLEWIEDDEAQNAQASSVLAESGEQFRVAHILESELFRSFDPLSEPDRLEPAVYTAVYGSFLDVVMHIAGCEVLDPINE